MLSTSEILQETVRPFFLVSLTATSRPRLEFRVGLETDQGELMDGHSL